MFSNESQLVYCLFMFTCFNELLPNQHSSHLKDCQLYSAPSDGFDGHDAYSWVCNSLNQSQAWEHIPRLPYNTLAITGCTIFDKNLNLNVDKINTMSLVLIEPSLGKQHLGKTIFNVINADHLNFLTISGYRRISSDIFPWTDLANFANLEAISIDRFPVNEIPFNFLSLLLKARNLHTVIVKNAKIETIHRDAFNTKKARKLSPLHPTNRRLKLRRLVLCNNNLRSLSWLTSLYPHKLSFLHELDLSNNQLVMLPETLARVVPNVRLLNLAGNRFRVFTYQSLLPWFNVPEVYLTNKPNATLLYDKNMEWITDSANWNKIKSNTLKASLAADNYLTQQDNKAVRESFTNLTHRFPIDKNPALTPFSTSCQNDLPCFGGENKELLMAGVKWCHKYYLGQRADSDEDRAKFFQAIKDLLKRGEMKYHFSSIISIPMFGGHIWEQIKGGHQPTDEDVNNIVDDINDMFAVIGESNVRVLLSLWQDDFDGENIIEDLRIRRHLYLIGGKALQRVLRQIRAYPNLLGVSVPFPSSTENDNQNEEAIQISNLVEFLNALNNTLQDNLVVPIGITLNSNKWLGISQDLGLNFIELIQDANMKDTYNQLFTNAKKQLYTGTMDKSLLYMFSIRNMEQQEFRRQFLNDWSFDNAYSVFMRMECNTQQQQYLTSIIPPGV